MTKALILAALAVVVAISGIWYFDLVHATPKPMTIDQCRTALAASTEFHKFVDNMDEANRSAAYVTGAMRCVLDHDQETASWSAEKKLAVVMRAYCNKQAGGNSLVQVLCDEIAEKELKRYKEHGIEAIIIPNTLQ
jgi:hypothetical protein